MRGDERRSGHRWTPWLACAALVALAPGCAPGGWGDGHGAALSWEDSARDDERVVQLNVRPDHARPWVAPLELFEPAPPVPLKVLMDTFDLDASPEPWPLSSEVVHVIDGDAELWFHPDGAAEFVDHAALDRAAGATPLPSVALQGASSRLLRALELDEHALIEVVGEAVEERWAVDESREQGSLQAAILRQYVDGLPGFGDGAAVTVLFAGDDDVAAFHHTLRGVRARPLEEARSQAGALDGWLRRVDKGAPWNVLEHELAVVDRILVDAVELGYYVPDRHARVEGYEPVYRIEGIATGVDAEGFAVDGVSFVWFEPALEGPGPGADASTF